MDTITPEQRGTTSDETRHVEVSRSADRDALTQAVMLSMDDFHEGLLTQNRTLLERALLQPGLYPGVEKAVDGTVFFVSPTKNDMTAAIVNWAERSNPDGFKDATSRVEDIEVSKHGVASLFVYFTDRSQPDNEWLDAFTLVNVDGRWKIAVKGFAPQPSIAASMLTANAGVSPKMSRASESADRKAITRVLANYWDGVRNQDKDLLDPLFSEASGVIGVEYGEDRTETLCFYGDVDAAKSYWTTRENEPGFGKSKNEIESINVKGQRIAVAHTLVVDGSENASRSSKEVVTLAKVDGKWRILAVVYVPLGRAIDDSDGD